VRRDGADHPRSGDFPGPLPPSAFSPQSAKTLDRMFNAYLANVTGGLDPRVIPLTFLDWWVKLLWSPGTHARLSEKAFRKWLRLGLYASTAWFDPETPAAIEPLPQDRRFRDPAWERWPFNLMSQSFLLTQQWWANASTGVPALSNRRKHIVDFVTRQALDMVSPANAPATNPEVLEATLRQGGANFLRGWQNWMDDWQRLTTGRKPAGTEAFTPGRRRGDTGQGGVSQSPDRVDPVCPDDRSG